MTYKKKAAVLSALVAVLALVYILTFVLDPEQRRENAFAWLDPSLIDMADGIEIQGSGGGVFLSRKNNIWILVTGTGEFPVRQDRVNDLFALLSQKAPYPVRAVSSEGRETLGLADGAASGIRVLGGAGLPLLDLLIGGEDVMGREVYLRRNEEEEVYSGEYQFVSFADSGSGFWYDLRLFPPGTETGGNYAAPSVIGIESIQEAEVAFPGRETFTLTRAGGGWIMRRGGESFPSAGSGNPADESAAPETARVEAWLRSVVEAEGEDFVSSAAPGAADFTAEGSVTLRFGDGTSRILRIGPAGGRNNRSAVVSDSAFVYTLSESAIGRLFRESSYFINR